MKNAVHVAESPSWIRQQVQRIRNTELEGSYKPLAMPHNPTDDSGIETEEAKIKPTLTSSSNKNCVTHRSQMTLDEYEAAKASREKFLSGKRQKGQDVKARPAPIDSPTCLSRSRKKGDQDDAMQAVFTKYTTSVLKK